MKVLFEQTDTHSIVKCADCGAPLIAVANDRRFVGSYDEMMDLFRYHRCAGKP